MLIVVTQFKKKKTYTKINKEFLDFSITSKTIDTHSC